MSSLWGGLAGLGEGLQQVGTDMYKSALADRLEKDRELRAEERQKAKEARDEARADALVQTTEFYENADGALMKRSLNRKGDTLREDLATTDEIAKRRRDADKAKREEQMHSLDMDGKALRNAFDTRKLEDYDEDKSLDRRLRQAQINAANYRASGSGRGTSSGGLEDTVSAQDYANLLGNDPSTKAFIESLSEGEDALSAEEINRLKLWAVTESARTGVDARTLLLEAKERGESVFSRYNPGTGNSGFPGALQVVLPGAKGGSGAARTPSRD